MCSVGLGVASGMSSHWVRGVCVWCVCEGMYVYVCGVWLVCGMCVLCVVCEGMYVCVVCVWYVCSVGGDICVCSMCEGIYVCVVCVRGCVCVACVRGCVCVWCVCRVVCMCAVCACAHPLVWGMVLRLYVVVNSPQVLWKILLLFCVSVRERAC